MKTVENKALMRIYRKDLTLPFKILNIIADELITKPKEIDILYKDIVPDETKGHIDQRDGRIKK